MGNKYRTLPPDQDDHRKRDQTMAGIAEELKSKFESEQQKAMLNVLFTANWFKSQQVGLFKPFGISPEQYNILRILRGAKGKMNMHSVKQRMLDRAPNATRLTDKLIAKKLVSRERCEEDRRVVYVQITGSGLELLERIDQKSKDFVKNTLDGIPSEDAAALNRVLDHWRG